MGSSHSQAGPLLIRRHGTLCQRLRDVDRLDFCTTPATEVEASMCYVKDRRLTRDDFLGATHFVDPAVSPPTMLRCMMMKNTSAGVITSSRSGKIVVKLVAYWPIAS